MRRLKSIRNFSGFSVTCPGRHPLPVDTLETLELAYPKVDDAKRKELDAARKLLTAKDKRQITPSGHDSKSE